MTQLTGVSVLVLTYNHARYIDACLSGIVTQKGIDLLEIVVADDFSTDGTRDILASWQKKDPRIKVLFNPKNLGAAHNLANALKSCSHAYLAFCEGDDFWIDPVKLQKQVATLDQHRDATMVYTNYHKTDASGIIFQKNCLPEQPEKFRMKDLVFSQGPSTNALIIRKNNLPEQFPDAFFKVLNPDVFIFAYALMDGYGIFMDFPGSAYRIHGSGIWSSLQSREQHLIRYSTRMTILKTLQPSDWQSMYSSMEADFEQSMDSCYHHDRALFDKYRPFLRFSALVAIRMKRLRNLKNRFGRKNKGHS